MIDETHDPARESWVASANGHADFPVQNLPLGIALIGGGGPRAVTAIGDHVIDLAAAADEGLLPGEIAAALQASTLNDLFAYPPAARRALRRRLSDLLCDSVHQKRIEPMLIAAGDVQMALPFRIGDYTDFYVGIHHAENVGKQFRPDNPLLPNYKHVPIGYHGRASSVRLSGTPVVRPSGQTKAPDADAPGFGPCRRLDYELELGLWITGGNGLGQPVPIGSAGSRIGGYCLLNDWSARDIQAWEYQPLGPFLAKNFLSSVSPWVVTADAMAPFHIAQPKRSKGDPQPLPYLWDEADQAGGALSVALEVTIASARMRTEGIAPHRLSRGETDVMYWTPAQLVAHHTSNGCNLASGDLLGTGTLSGASDTALGSLMEISRGGKAPITLPTGEQRSFLEDGDELVMRAVAHAEGRVSIGFGECRGVVEPARV